MSEKALIYIHGKGGTADAAEFFEKIFAEFDIYGFDYKAELPWEAETEFKEYVTALYKKYGKLTVMPNGEHWFHTDEQNEFRDKWLRTLSSVI